MLVARETIERNPQRTTAFTIGETVHVVSLNRTGRVVGTEAGIWLVRLTEGDTPIRCNVGDMEKRSTLFG